MITAGSSTIYVFEGVVTTVVEFWGGMMRLMVLGLSGIFSKNLF